MRDELKDHEEQEAMEIRDSEDDAVCNVCRTLENIQYTKNRKWLIFDTCEMIMYVQNMYQQTQI